MLHTHGLERTYQNAIQIIESRRRRGRPKNSFSGTESAKPMPDGSTDFRGTPSISGMEQWLQALGHSANDINSLNVIHIAGTKGKGSTCAFVESFLRVHGEREGFPQKTGLYTSPHLIVPEERIRINSRPLDRMLFAKYFFEIYDKLPQLASKYDPAALDSGPRFLQLYALFAFHVFIREKVGATIIETHNGGEYDATNVVQRPVVTAITTLGMDHVEMLGPSIRNIAWHKSGIYKTGSVALSTVQDPVPAQVLKDRARGKCEEVRFLGEDARLPLNTLHLKPKVQRKNASLALAAAEAFLDRKGPKNLGSLTPEDICNGVEQWSWPGRFQVIHDGERGWFLDSAHNEMSVAIAAQWFAESCAELDKSAMHILIFSHISELRDSAGLLNSLAKAVKESDLRVAHVVFTTYDETEESSLLPKFEKLTAFYEIWKKSLPTCEIWNEPTVQGAISLAKKLAISASPSNTQILVTGSQHLVGPALHILQSK